MKIQLFPKNKTRQKIAWKRPDQSRTKFVPKSYQIRSCPESLETKKERIKYEHATF